ncbi:MAG: hydroxymethylbilane synthase [Verrucomicrobiota bacterium]
MASDPFILGTRGSDLALMQAKMTQTALEAAGIDRVVEQNIIATTGDKRQDLKLSAPNLDKAVFTKELEDALDEKSIHAAVHSLKDVPTILEPRFGLAAVLPRAPIEDVVVTKSIDHAENGLDSLPEGGTVATSSVRRHRQIQERRPDLNLVEIRGNVPTRLRKVATLPEIDATILAHAGLKRLGFDLSQPSLAFEDHQLGFAILPPAVMIPAAGQGAVAIEIRAEDDESREILSSINHDPTWQRIRVERAFLHALGASCQTPVGVHTELIDGGKIQVQAIVFQDVPEGEVPTEPPKRVETLGDANLPKEIAADLMSQLS